MFTNYVTDREFYAAYPMEQWIPRETIEQRLRDAARAVASDLRSSGVDTLKIMIPIMFTGELYATETQSGAWESDAVTPYNASRLVIQTVSQEGNASFTLQGSKDSTTYHSVVDVQDGMPLTVVSPGEGIVTGKFFEKYRAMKLVLDADDTIKFSAYVVDDSPSELIMWKAVITGLFPLLSRDTRVEDLYDTAKHEYNSKLASIRIDYDRDASNSISESEADSRRQVVLYR
jgi:hypothetical protein